MTSSMVSLNWNGLPLPTGFGRDESKTRPSSSVPWYSIVTVSPSDGKTPLPFMVQVLVRPGRSSMVSPSCMLLSLAPSRDCIVCAVRAVALAVGRLAKAGEETHGPPWERLELDVREIALMKFA